MRRHLVPNYEPSPEAERDPRLMMYPEETAADIDLSNIKVKTLVEQTNFLNLIQTFVEEMPKLLESGALSHVNLAEEIPALRREPHTEGYIDELESEEENV